jgi:hypothetical protein
MSATQGAKNGNPGKKEILRDSGMLRSQLFRGNSRLEHAAVDHSTHITFRQSNPEKGDFVSKIQEALVILDNAIITGDDVGTQTYKEPTANAVLAYKSGARNIVGSYQTSPDNIVGIMTIARMDQEMADFETRAPGMIDRARQAGFQRCFAAFIQAGGILPPPPPGRPDPNVSNRLRARNLARDIFNNPSPNIDDIADVLGDMKNRLASPNTPIDRAHFPDPRCGLRAAFVAGNRVPIVLCPSFFAGTDEERIRTMVHESAHLTGIGDPNGEAYYLKFNSLNEDPSIVVGKPPSNNRADFADTWAKYVNSVTFQPTDP